jgi:hypothetical protein
MSLINVVGPDLCGEMLFVCKAFSRFARKAIWKELQVDHLESLRVQDSSLMTMLTESNHLQFVEHLSIVFCKAQEFVPENLLKMIPQLKAIDIGLPKSCGLSAFPLEWLTSLMVTNDEFFEKLALLGSRSDFPPIMTRSSIFVICVQLLFAAPQRFLL